ncbi:MAG TPA: YcxB family protein [Edaphobacter sp.]|nr:YcxB family protein [Edaphobacter sp.]
MQVRATVSATELQEAARLSRPRLFWLKFFAANWYSSVICLLVVGVAINALINHERMNWGAMAMVFAICVGFIGFSWFRWNSSLAKSAEAASARAGTLSLDSDGVRTRLASGTSTFIPWSTYSKWIEGRSVFLVTGNDGTTVIPIDDGNRDAIRSLLMSKIL